MDQHIYPGTGSRLECEPKQTSDKPRPCTRGAMRRAEPATAAELDGAVTEVFESMLGTMCAPCRGGCTGDGERISATIRVRGGREGVCVVELPAEAGDWLTDSMMGTQADWDQEMVHDAVGELCNMITGGVKRRLGPWPGDCRMSLPTVSRRSAGSVTRPGFGDGTGALRRFYAVAETTLTVWLELYRTTD